MLLALLVVEIALGLLVASAVRHDEPVFIVESALLVASWPVPCGWRGRGWPPAWLATDAIVARHAVRDVGNQGTTDGLDGIGNRRALEQAVASALAHAARFRESLALMLIDLDGFKDVNDRLAVRPATRSWCSARSSSAPSLEPSAVARRCSATGSGRLGPPSHGASSRCSCRGTTPWRSPAARSPPRSSRATRGLLRRRRRHRCPVARRAGAAGRPGDGPGDRDRPARRCRRGCRSHSPHGGCARAHGGAPLGPAGHMEGALERTAELRSGQPTRRALTPRRFSARRARRTLDVGIGEFRPTVFGVRRAGAAKPRRSSGTGIRRRPGLLAGLSHTKVVHLRILSARAGVSDGARWAAGGQPFDNTNGLLIVRPVCGASAVAPATVGVLRRHRSRA